MVRQRRGELVDSLRRRIQRALQVQALGPGDRLPGTRELAREFRTDPRVVADAYRALAGEGLVELRARSGVFVSSKVARVRRRPDAPPQWMAELFVQGVARGIAVPELPGVLRRALGQRPLRTVVIATTVDQTDGLCRELRADLGLEARGVLAETIVPRRELPRAVRRAQLLVTTEVHVDRVSGIAARLGKPFVPITVRSDLYDMEWALFRGQEAYVIVADRRFGSLVREYLHSVGADSGVHILLAGRDDLSRIPDDAPVYATQAARARIGATRLPAGLLPPARTISDDCARDIMTQVLLLASAS
ncbi:MAG: GntR family transcriptional regulator [Gemmatimonadaceae bacterium]